MIDRGEIHQIDLGVPEGHEVGRPHPGLIVSDPRMHEFDLVIVCPITSTRHGWPSHIEIEPDLSGLPDTSYIQTEQVRCLSASRLRRRSGQVDLMTLHQVDRALRRNLGLWTQEHAARRAGPPGRPGSPTDPDRRDTAPRAARSR